jgi:hypothetical protein
MPQRVLSQRQRLQEHLEDALAEADSLKVYAVAALVSEALDALKALPDIRSSDL